MIMILWRYLYLFLVVRRCHHLPRLRVVIPGRIISIWFCSLALSCGRFLWRTRNLFVTRVFPLVIMFPGFDKDLCSRSQLMFMPAYRTRETKSYLLCPQFGIFSTGCDEAIMSALLHDLAIINDHDPVGIDDGRKSMGNNERGATLAKAT